MRSTVSLVLVGVFVTWSAACDSDGDGETPAASPDAVAAPGAADAGAQSFDVAPPTPDSVVDTADATPPMHDAAEAVPDAAEAVPDAAEAVPDAEPAPGEDCVATCVHFDMCGSCFQDAMGVCLSLDACAEVCRAETPPAAAACIAGLVACDDDALTGCFDANIGDDDCANACRYLDRCDECFADEDGQCLGLAGCALVCRDSTPPATTACIAALEDCDGDAVTACFQL